MATADVAEQFDDMEQQRRADLVGMWVFLATELLLFGGLLAAYTVLRVQHTATFAEAATHLDIKLGAVNTALLLTSGLTMALAEHAANSQRRRPTIFFIAVTVALGCVFLGIKGYEWYHEYTESLMPVLGMVFHYPGEDPQVAELFFNLYYAMTGLHAAHMLIGLGLLVVLGGAVHRWRQPARLDRQVQIIGLYWAFVDVVWIFVFTSLYLLRA